MIISMFTLVGTLAAGGGLMTTFMLPSGLKYALPNFLNLSPRGVVYPMFMNPPFKLVSSYHLFAIKNRKAFLNGTKLRVGLKGPYNYVSGLGRTNVRYRQNEEIIQFDTQRTLVLNEETSKDLDEKLWLVNPIVASIQVSVKMMVLDRVPFKAITEPIVFNSVNLLLDQFNERLIARKSPRELLEGVKVEMLEFLMNSADRFGLKNLIPPGPANNIFGVAYQQNQTIDNQEIYAGLGDTKHRLADVIGFNGKKVLTAWSGKCNLITGTNGELYKPFITGTKPIRIFLGPTCRSFDIEPVGRSQINGIEVIEFSFSQRLYQTYRTFAANECFCKDKRLPECTYDGYMPMGPCFFDTPLFFSRPDFRGVDPKFLGLLANTNIEELKAHNKTKQSFFLEPITGTPVRVDISFASWFKLVRQNYMRDMSNIQKVTFAPAFIASEYLQLPPEVSSPLGFLQMAYEKPGVIGTGACCSGAAIYLVGLMRRRRAKPGVAPAPTQVVATVAPVAVAPKGQRDTEVAVAASN